MRDSATDSAIRSIGSNAGFKLKMDDVGNILIKRTAGTTTHVTVENTTGIITIPLFVRKIKKGGFLVLLDWPPAVQIVSKDYNQSRFGSVALNGIRRGKV